jgi:pimeloyl-ACP methyl ester carboxylesterase
MTFCRIAPTAALALALVSSAALAQKKEPIALADMGSFHIGGREVTLSGMPIKEVVFTPGGVPAKVDLNGTYQVEQMYVQYFIPAVQRGTVPLLLWHGGGLTGVTYETTPDGRDGWLNMFLRRGWAVYNSDAVERGRSGWAMYPDIFTSEPIFLTKSNPFERFRIGAGAGSYDKDPAKMKVLPGNQFPLDGYDNFTKQNVPRWTTTDAAIIAAYTALVDKVCPCAILVHSQAGQFGLRVAQARPEKVKALVLVEPAGTGEAAAIDKLAGIPILSVYGDFIEQDARWPTIRANGIKFLDAGKDKGVTHEVIDLPKAGIKGNGHMLMMDKNNGEVASLIQDWLAKKGLYK